ncbi:hypothetical protein PRIPAC_76108 [Pristionchus pacificus]|uniref:Uncharacterized protein n=1 Tax=Pristionchus pacificus TaxID=54126 RepID=A0A2A6D0B0_PRIPA|nr:hypothetical protein PRIPAC_76108 [Pristionchus pacificus]|eukprot:PDM83721.1 hypothetical protein PRIPAC_30208 [Pristionchus pacificus]
MRVFILILLLINLSFIEANPRHRRFPKILECIGAKEVFHGTEHDPYKYTNLTRPTTVPPNELTYPPCPPSKKPKN